MAHEPMGSVGEMMGRSAKTLRHAFNTIYNAPQTNLGAFRVVFQDIPRKLDTFPRNWNRVRKYFYSACGAAE